MSSVVSKIENNSGLNEKKLQTLAKNISNLFVDDNDSPNTAKRDNIIKEIYNKKEVDDELVKKAQKAALEYYQIQQFKRAHFKCTGVEYDNITGIIKSIGFEFNGTFN